MSERRSSSRLAATTTRKTALQRLADAKRSGARQIDSLDVSGEVFRWRDSLLKAC
jgi:hypothetical protein